MRLVRRLSAALSSALLLQLSLLGSGTLCALQHPSGHGAMGAGSLAMPGMGRGATRIATVSAVSEQPTNAPEIPADACGGHGSGDSCGGPWATGPCASMGTCAPSQSATVPPVLAAPTGETTVNHPAPRTLHAGPVFAPELPPPRV